MQERLGVVEKEAKLGSTELHHEKRRMMPGDKALLKADEALVRAVNEDVSRSEPATAMWA